MTNVPISDERLAEIEAGLWHVSCGPWTVEPHGNTTALYSGREATAHGFRLLNLDDGDSNFAANAAHIARCDPDTIRAMIARVRAAEVERDALRRSLLTQTEGASVLAQRIDALRAQVETLREALLLWQGYGCPICQGDCSSANPPVSGCPMRETRAALAATEPKKAPE